MFGSLVCCSLPTRNIHNAFLIVGSDNSSKLTLTAASCNRITIMLKYGALNGVSRKTAYMYIFAKEVKHMSGWILDFGLDVQ
jgi:hypothetical protein